MLCYIDNINERLVQLAHLRRQRALVGMPNNYQQVFKLLPLLFHYNYPSLPGYIEDNEIYGIDDFEPDQALVKFAEQYYQIALCQPNSSPRIAALYSMGSTCSLGQTVNSDLDIWVCIQNPLSKAEKATLQSKCSLIENWARQLGVALSLFIVDVNRFRNNYHDCLMGDNCGSTQHMLLLEEFYRTSNVIAGKLLLWFRIPLDLTINGIQYASYEQCIDALVNEKVIDRNDWLDFGPLQSLSAEEYFGASLWQLYKSIDSPYKAVLKSILLEAYFWEYPNSYFIASEIKQLIHQNKTDYFDFDPYYMLLEKVTHYLIAIGDKERLELARQCFYIKIEAKLSVKTANPTWRHDILHKLVKAWGWNSEKLIHLDHCHSWKITDVCQANDQLLNTMMTSYRNLLNVGRRNNLEAQISPRDLAILTRKLYATYEVLPGKVSIINPNISIERGEQALTFIHVSQDRVNRAGWYIYNKELTTKYNSGGKYLEFSPNLLKLVAWSYFNKLITNKTKLYFWDQGKQNNHKLLQLVTDLKSYFPIQGISPTEEAFYSPCEIRHLAIIINLENDPTKLLEDSDIAAASDSIDVLNYGDAEMSLVGSIDFLYRNSWNEIRLLHFDGESSILDALKNILNRMHKDADVPHSIEIFCYSERLKSIIIEQIKTLFHKCIGLRLSSTQTNLVKFKPVRFAGKSWTLFFERLGVSIHCFNNTIDFYGAITNNKLHGRALSIYDEANELPKEIDSIACEGIIQFFFEDTDKGFDLYILNEHNQIEIYKNCNGSKYNMIRYVNEYYTLADDRFTFASSSSINFNLPQFYQITLTSQGERQIMPFA